MDPLRRALDRGAKGLDLLNSPLVQDYVHVKFTGTLPSWLSRNPFQPTVNEGESVSVCTHTVLSRRSLQLLTAVALFPLSDITDGVREKKFAPERAREAESERYILVRFKGLINNTCIVYPLHLTCMLTGLGVCMYTSMFKPRITRETLTKRVVT